MTINREGLHVKPRTGFVRVTFEYGHSVIVKADSFAEAAAEVDTRRGQIIRFEWADRPAVAA